MTSDPRVAAEQPPTDVEGLRQLLDTEVRRRQQAERELDLRERELADFVDNAVEALHKVDGNGIILWANRAELSMLGYTPEEYIGRSITDFHADAEVISDILARLLRGEAIYDYPARLRCKNGQIKHVSIHSNGCFHDGGLMYTRCYTRDATLAQERERLLRELGSASRAKDEFLAMLGHELRNPLAPIVTALSLMNMRGDTKTAHEQGIIERQVNHMVRLVDDLLDVSRVTGGKIELRLAEAELSDTLANSVELASLLLEQRRQNLALDVAPRLKWVCDRARLAQIVANLLTNAAKYSPVGGQIYLRAWQPLPDELAISVRDNGDGIEPEKIQRLFELFFQVEQSVDRPQGGLGIGLALVKSLVELHGGTVQAFSDGLGRGSEFIVRLPRLSVQAASVADAATPDVTHSPPVENGSRKLVAVVDDNVDNADVVGELLSAEGFEVAVFYDPSVALLAFAERCPDLAILDIGLPVMDGYELASRMRQLPTGQSCTLIALSGYGRPGDRQRSETAGFQFHLVKPTSSVELLQTVHRALAIT